MSNDQPQFVWGKPNPNWKGPQPASKNGVGGSREHVSSDFMVSHPALSVDFEDADLDTKLSQIDFADFTPDEPWENYENNTRIGSDHYVEYVYADGDDVVLSYEFEDNPQSSIHSLLADSGFRDPEADHPDELEDFEGFPDDYYTAYEESWQEWAENNGASGMDPDLIEYDYGRLGFYTSINRKENPDATLHNLHDNLSGVYNAMTYQVPSDVTERFVKKLEDKGYTFSER